MSRYRVVLISIVTLALTIGFDAPEARKTLQGRLISSEPESRAATDQVGAPFEVGTAAQLFVDRLLVRDTDRVWFEQHQGKKHPDNPLLKADQPWEGWRMEIFGNVLFDDDEKIFKMWYLPEEGPGAEYFDDPNVTCYATSRDGVHWEKPLVGTLNSKNGKPHNAVAHIHQASVIKDPRDPDPNRRYKCLGYCSAPSGYHTFVSPDGLNWTRLTEKPIGVGGDVMTGYWDDRLHTFVAIHKIQSISRGHRRREFVTRKSSDFAIWSDPVLSFTIDARDDLGSLARIEQVRPILDQPDNLSLMRTEYYGVGVYAAESCTLAFPWMLTINNNARWGNHEGPQEIQLAVSRDLVQWERPFRTPVIAIGELDRWDASYHTTASSAIRVKDEIWLYYSGANYTHGTPAIYRPQFEDGRSTGRKDKYTASIGLVTWPLDRFVSANAGSEGGSLTTIPVRFGGSRLEINAATQPDGNIIVELLDTSGKPLPNIPPSQPLSGDSLRFVVRFGNLLDLSTVRDQPVTIRFRMKNAELYSFAFRE